MQVKMHKWICYYVPRKKKMQARIFQTLTYSKGNTNFCKIRLILAHV